MPNFMHKLCSNAIKEMLGLHFLKVISVDIRWPNRIDTQIETSLLYLYISLYIFISLAHTLLITRWQFQNTLYLRHCSKSSWERLSTWPIFSYGLKPPEPFKQCQCFNTSKKTNWFAGWILHQLPYVLFTQPNLSNRKGHQNWRNFCPLVVNCLLDELVGPGSWNYTFWWIRDRTMQMYGKKINQWTVW